MFNVTAEYALYEMSYINTLMYSHATPALTETASKKDDSPAFDESLDACNPDNFNDTQEITV